MAVLLVTHAELVRDEEYGDPHHTLEGYQKLNQLMGMVRDFIARDARYSELTMVYKGFDRRTKDVFDAFEDAFFVSNMKWNYRAGVYWPLSSGVSHRSKHLGHDVVFDQYHLRMFRADCRLPTDCLPPSWFWHDAEIIEDEQGGHNAFKVMCGGRFYLRCLGKASAFRMASVYQLNFEDQEVECIIEDCRWR